jgi:two-component system sensor histidine kinase PilS (NtrC family)
VNLRSRLATLIAVRVVVSTLLLGSAILIQLNRPGVFPVDPFFFLIGLTYGLSVIYLVSLRYVGRHAWLADVQFAADAMLVSAFIHITGGISSLFSTLYVLPIIAASTVRFRRGAIQVATLSALLYLALVRIQYTEVPLPAMLRMPPSVSLPDPSYARYTAVINLSGFFAVAILAGSLAEGLRSAGVRLEDASHEIEDLRAFNEHVIDNLLSGLATADTDHRILTFNRAAAAITGIPPDRAIGTDIGDVLQVPAHFRTQVSTLAERRSMRIDLHYQTPDGRTIDVGLSTSRLMFPNGLAGYLYTFQDVTELKRLERDGRLQQRLAAVGEMAAGIAHEIRNPLASMSGSIQVLRQELPLSGDQAQLMDIVLKESERLNNTIRSFLAYARPQRSAMSTVDVRIIMQDAAALLRNSADVREEHVIAVDVPADPVWYDADENQIRQVVWNLATNGLRAMASQGRLLLSARNDPPGHLTGDVVITVEDQGCGIAPDDLDGIFQPFRSTFEKGTGLGLPIVHRIVTDYSGVIQVSSTLGSGTSVHVRLPHRAGSSAEAASGGTSAEVSPLREASRRALL